MKVARIEVMAELFDDKGNRVGRSGSAVKLKNSEDPWELFEAIHKASSALIIHEASKLTIVRTNK